MESKTKEVSLSDLQQALTLIEQAPHDLKRELFKNWINNLEEDRNRWVSSRGLPQHKQSRLSPPQDAAFYTSYRVSRLMRMLTGYNSQWVFDYFVEVNSQAGRKNSYGKDEHEFFVWFVHQLLFYGNTKVKKESAYRLVAYLCDQKRKPGFNTINSGLQRAVADAYREMEVKKIDVEEDLLDSGHWFCFLIRNCYLSSKPTHLMMKRGETDEAVLTAFRAMIQSLIDQMKSIIPIIREKDSYWRKGVFGWVPIALEKDYSDPLDFLYENHPQGELEKAQKGHELMEFVNAAGFWRDAPPDFQQVESPDENLFTWDEIFRTATG